MVKKEKAFWKSKTVQGGVLVFIGGGLHAIGLTELGTMLMTAGVSLGFVGIRTANTNLI